MPENKQPEDNFQQLYDDIKKYILLQTEYAKVEIIEKMTILLSTLLIIGLIIVLAIAVLFYLSFSLSYTLEPFFGSLALSFAVISGIYVLLIVILLVFRKNLIINPLVRFLSGLFLKKEEKL